MRLRRRHCLAAAVSPWIASAAPAAEAAASAPVAPVAEAAAARQRRAMLVGVADYPNLPRRLWLQGPVNDVQLMRTTLQAIGYSADDADVLHSRAGGAREPTLANVHAAMARMAARARPGDRIALHLAGHGARQPQAAGVAAEADGLDEVFLCADAAGWDGRGDRASIAGALHDDTIGDWIDGLVDRGVQVAVFFDCCHAGGMARGEDGKRVRGVAGVELGVGMGVKLGADPGVARVAVATPNVPTLPRSDGRLLAFAARGTEVTLEERLPRGVPPARSRVHGVFSFELAMLLAAGARGAMQIERKLRDAYALGGRLTPLPSVQGASSLE